MKEDSELIETLQTLAITDTRAGIYAQNLLGKVLDEYYPMNVLYPEEDVRMMKPETTQVKNSVAVGDYILYPNPTSESFVISKKDNSFISECFVKLVDVSFREIQSFTVSIRRSTS